MRLRPRSVTLLVLVPVLLASGCTKDAGSPPPTSLALGPDAETVTVPMRAVDTRLVQVGPDGSRTYGQNVLRGAARVDGRPATVEILGNVEYADGSGPFYGFLTVTWADRSTLAFSMRGGATKAKDGSTSLVAGLPFLGGSGRLESATAAARFTGSRAAAVGSPISIRLTIDVVDGK